MDLTSTLMNDFEEEIFDKQTLFTAELDEMTFSDCLFRFCRFSDCTFTGTVFRNCRFENCDFSLVKVDSTGFSNCLFKDCRIQGVNFHDCNRYQFNPDFEDTVIAHSFFSDQDMAGKSFRRCTINDCEFAHTQLKEADFSECSFNDTKFSSCNLEKANFKGATGYAFHPGENKVKGAKFSYPDVVNLLSPLGIIIDD
ncbi:pentapeptide repeat-containing protein [Spirochaeta isovalerica]|uniref:Uncharacterized protein YjbI with pentapeptide repeats n=1 Tax=Spirochaeta isovalerica TaxID=150 RepID=A0A841R9M0_9SPIO|nr:pentapeptide repeat-containing protein [Spirochaeta isovalerica]MBB6480466.1 uncharacterized protein YjbI with pentapeptide repeats [Spirochaeta isovalerica]